MKKIVMSAVAVLALVAFVACGGGAASGGKAEAKKMLTDAITSMEKVITEIEGAKDGKSALAAVKGFYEVMKSIQVKGQELEKKYPDLKSLEKSEEFKADGEKFGELIKKFGAIMPKLAEKFKDDKEFMEAMQNLGKTMGGE
jgi:hypothetical protein